MGEFYRVVDRDRVRYKGVFELEELYRLMYNFFYDEGYDIWERKYNEKDKELGRELEIKWATEKKITEYIKYHIKIEFYIVGMRDVLIKQDGVKIKMQRGDIEIRFIADVETDYRNQWESQPLFKFLRTIYEKYIFHPEILYHQETIYKKVYQIHNNVKSFLNLYKFKS